jgi:hypothetical protein
VSRSGRRSEVAEAVTGLDQGEGADTDGEATLSERNGDGIGPWIVEVVDQPGELPLLDLIAKREFGLEQPAARREGVEAGIVHDESPYFGAPCRRRCSRGEDLQMRENLPQTVLHHGEPLEIDRRASAELAGHKEDFVLVGVVADHPVLGGKRTDAVEVNDVRRVERVDEIL